MTNVPARRSGARDGICRRVNRGTWAARASLRGAPTAPMVRAHCRPSASAETCTRAAIATPAVVRRSSATSEVRMIVPATLSEPTTISTARSVPGDTATPPTIVVIVPSIGQCRLAATPLPRSSTTTRPSPACRTPRAASSASSRAAVASPERVSPTSPRSVAVRCQARVSAADR